MKDPTAASQTPNLDRARAILGKQRRQLEREARALAWLDSRAPDANSARTVSRRAHTRRRGAGRPKAQATRSSARSGDSGEDGEPPSDPPSERPPERRPCAFCGGDIPADRGPKAKHCNDNHAANSRQRRKRQRDRERDVRPPILADERRMYEFDAGELVRLLRDATCACNGGHIPDDDELLGQRCTKCGRQRPSSWCGRRLLEQLTFRLAERKGAAL